MTEKKVFKCEGCEKAIEIDSQGDEIPECCGQPMKQDLPVCTTTDTAEHSRFNESGAPCDDGRSG